MGDCGRPSRPSWPSSSTSVPATSCVTRRSTVASSRSGPCGGTLTRPWRSRPTVRESGWSEEKPQEDAGMQASASTKELLENDAADPVVRLDRHPLWEAALDGRLAKERLRELVVTFYPTVTGTARYLFSSKVSTLMPEDGKAVFRDLYDALTVPEASADRGGCGPWSTATSTTPGGRTRPGGRPGSACGRGRAWASESAWRDQRTER